MQPNVTQHVVASMQHGFMVLDCVLKVTKWIATAVDWDDYQYLLRIAQMGSVRGAAQQLGVNASTVTRRLEAVEDRLGVVLFSRSQRGLTMTSQGREVVERLKLLQTQIEDIELSLKGSDDRMQGRIRVAVSDDVAAWCVLPGAPPFLRQYPGIELVLEDDLNFARLAAGSVDVVVAATDTPPEEMIARPVGQVLVGGYASRELIDEVGGVERIGYAPWVDWASTAPLAAFCRGLRSAQFERTRVQLRCDQVLLQLAAIEAGIGAGVLPTALISGSRDLLALPQIPVQSGPMMWLITHPDFRAARRVQEITRYLRGLFVERSAA